MYLCIRVIIFLLSEGRFKTLVLLWILELIELISKFTERRKSSKRLLLERSYLLAQLNIVFTLALFLVKAIAGKIIFKALH